MTTNELLDLLVREYAVAAGVDERVAGQVLSEQVEGVFRDCGVPVLPGPDQSVAVSIKTPKTAALVYDRVWGPPNTHGGPPTGIAIFGASPFEVFLPAVVKLTGDDVQLRKAVIQRVLPKLPVGERGPGFSPRAIAAGLTRSHGVQAIPLYPTADERNREYRAGDTEVVVTVLRNLQVVDETTLTWEQVAEFRADPDARRRYRRFVHWLDRELVGKPASYVADEIVNRLEDYDAAVTKHGIQTVVGSIEQILDPKFLAGAAAVSGATLLSGSILAALGAAGSLVAARIGLTVARSRLDIDRATADKREIAFVHEIAKLSGPAG